MTEISMVDFPFYPGKKIKLYTYIFNRNNGSTLYFKMVTSLNGIILPFSDVIHKYQRTNRLIQFKQSMKKLSSKFTPYLEKKIRLYTYILNRKDTFLYILSKMKALSGIILPETSFTSLNDISRDAFPFIIPFHPGEGPEIDYPDAPVEPEDPDEDPGDEPGDSK